MAVLSFLASGLFLSGIANAHFNLNAPPTIGFDEDSEGTAPCGGFTPDFSKTLTDFHVGGEPIGTLLGHPQGNWLYRATLDQKASGNWTQLFPIVMQSGLGLFCETSVTAPSSWVGQKGVVSVVVDAPDGLLYQCAIVNFVSGTGTVDSSTCKNATAVQASFVGDSSLSSLVSGSGSSSGGGANTTGTTTPSGTATGTGSSSTPSTSKNAAPSFGQVDLSPTGLFAAAMMVVLGAALL
ncbi:hypothetical protein GQ53DRAFT_742459 [Thozetella sp. PMI_491]|nr:hypothetical protein GQ53DRAFT_742459 [Thozetella sp. PMI_491]